MSTIYVHWPFCLSKCHYCDFNSVACGKNINFQEWYVLYKNVLLKFKEEFYKNEQITSVYFGGGTPSLLSSWFISDILNEINGNFNLDSNAEITLEANPKTLDKSKAIELKMAGVNRLSIGVQSIIDADLQILGRVHNAEEAKTCIFDLANVFDNLSIDMLYNRPGQSVCSWESELTEVLKFPINHVSLYELIVEDNTKLKWMIESGMLQRPSESSEFFERTMEITEMNGFDMYEVSNFAKISQDANIARYNNQFYHETPAELPYGKHNISYWKYEDYYAIGPGSHSRVSIDEQKIAIEQISDNSKWIEWAKDPIFEKEFLSEDDEFKERLIMGLRSKCGINTKGLNENIKNKYGLKNKIKNLEKNSYIIVDEGLVALTRNGIMRLNLIIQYLTRE